MRAMGHYSFMRAQAAYVDNSPDPQRRCEHCDHIELSPRANKCQKGGFFVSKRGTCKNFDAANVGATS